MTLSISIYELYVTLSIMAFSIMTLNITMLCHYAHCPILLSFLIIVIIKHQRVFDFFSTSVKADKMFGFYES